MRRNKKAAAFALAAALTAPPFFESISPDKKTGPQPVDVLVRIFDQDVAAGVKILSALSGDIAKVNLGADQALAAQKKIAEARMQFSAAAKVLDAIAIHYAGRAQTDLIDQLPGATAVMAESSAVITLPGEKPPAITVFSDLAAREINSLTYSRFGCRLQSVPYLNFALTGRVLVCYLPDLTLI